MRFAAAIRPVIDRVYVGLRRASHEQVRAVYSDYGLRPGLEIDAYFALLDHPVPVAAVAEMSVYRGFDAAAEEPRGIVVVEGGAWHLTDRGRSLALAVETAIGEGTAALWGRRPIGTMPGLDGLDRLQDLVARLLEAGRASGGPAFAGFTPVHDGGSAAGLLASRLGALRHHRADAHRAAWRAEGLTADAMPELGPGPVRDRIEAATNERDDLMYACLSAGERLALLGGLGALPDGLEDR